MGWSPPEASPESPHHVLILMLGSCILIVLGLGVTLGGGWDLKGQGWVFALTQ